VEDIVGAKSRGVQAIGVSYGYGTEQELRPWGALIADSPDAIPPLVRSLLDG
jgi:phosphoglycolate phosphatase